MKNDPAYEYLSAAKAMLATYGRTGLNPTECAIFIGVDTREKKKTFEIRSPLIVTQDKTKWDALLKVIRSHDEELQQLATCSKVAMSLASIPVEENYRQGQGFAFWDGEEDIPRATDTDNIVEMDNPLLPVFVVYFCSIEVWKIVMSLNINELINN